MHDVDETLTLLTKMASDSVRGVEANNQRKEAPITT